MSASGASNHSLTGGGIPRQKRVILFEGWYNVGWARAQQSWWPFDGVAPECRRRSRAPTFPTCRSGILSGRIHRAWSNLGIGHGAIDAGGGYTYFNPQTGHELSGVLGFTSRSAICKELARLNVEREAVERDHLGALGCVATGSLGSLLRITTRETTCIPQAMMQRHR
jgi:hypothetical protein